MPEEDKEIIELWRLYKEESDSKARDRLILNYAPLVKYVAGRMGTNFPSHVEESDLISYGLLGLIGALERFEPERNIKFETYAITRIKGSILDELRSLDWVPRSVRSIARQIEKCSAAMENKLHR
ncbi:MAG: sigma-70 family RNA polymerase sigma factor, partial [Actinomycetota bacterium]